MQILKTGMKKWQAGRSRKISQSQRNFRIHSENFAFIAIFAIIAKFRYGSENVYGPIKDKATNSKVSKKKHVCFFFFFFFSIKKQKKNFFF